MLHTYFRKFGKIEDTKVINSASKCGNKQRYGFILFEQEADLKRTFCEGEEHEIGGEKVLCKQFLFREQLKTIKIEK